MTAPTKNVVDLAAATVLAGTDKVLMVDTSDTTEGPLGTVKIATIASLSTFFDVISAQGLTAVVNNGLVYVNSGGAITSGAGLQFDGTHLGQNGAAQAWGGSIVAHQINRLCLAGNAGGAGYMTSNMYYDGAGDRYLANGYAALSYAQEGAHIWKIAPVNAGAAGAAATLTVVKTIDASGHWLPGADNTQNLGSGALRMAVLYAGTGTINTSDAREKTPVTPMSAAHKAAAAELRAEIGVYQWLSAVESKGENARKHIGMTVQRAIEIMELHGLDPFGYGFICYDSWGGETKEVVCDDGEFSREVERHVAVETQVPYSEIQIIDGIPVRVAKTRINREPQYKAVSVVDEAGLPVIVDGKPMVHPVPVMETVTERYNIETVREAGDRYSFRPDELLLFMMAGI